MSITFDSIILILPQIKFEAIPSKDAGEVAFQPKVDRSHQILGVCHKSFPLVPHMALILEFLDSQYKDLSKMYTSAAPPPPPPPRSSLLKFGPNICVAAHQF